MTSIDRQSVRDALIELSDSDIQHKLWLSDGSDGSDGSEVSSFVEVEEQLFTDSGLIRSLSSGGSGFGPETDAVLRSLESDIRKIDVRRGPKLIINNPAMTQIRQLASELLRLIPVEPDDTIHVRNGGSTAAKILGTSQEAG